MKKRLNYTIDDCLVVNSPTVMTRVVLRKEFRENRHGYYIYVVACDPDGTMIGDPQTAAVEKTTPQTGQDYFDAAVQIVRQTMYPTDAYSPAWQGFEAIQGRTMMFTPKEPSQQLTDLLDKKQLFLVTR